MGLAMIRAAGLDMSNPVIGEANFRSSYSIIFCECRATSDYVGCTLAAKWDAGLDGFAKAAFVAVRHAGGVIKLVLGLFGGWLSQHDRRTRSDSQGHRSANRRGSYEREHSFKPLRGDVLLMGRQTVYYTPQQILAAFEEHGITPAIDPAAIELDTNTIDRLPAYKDADLITDKSLMMLSGVNKVMALDHSSYENAEIVHDLRRSLPEKLYNAADFLIDGSTLDNVFTPSTVIQNYSKLLRPGGRMLLLNAFSAYDTAYVIMPPMWFVDYFVMNGFADCRVYAMVVSEERTNTFSVELNDVFRLRREMGRLRSPYHMVSIVFAEKSANSTTDILPIQQDYRPAAEWEI